jgi:hypothetical protein
VSTGIWICILGTEKAPVNCLCERADLFPNDTTAAYGGKEILGEVPLCGEHFFVVKQKG